MSGKSGQVAVILILVVAAALIFYAISLNLGRISQTKVATTIAADTAASTMASYMASFGQSVFMTSLGGKRKICNWTGVVAAIFAVVIAIIAVIAAIYCNACSAPLWKAVVALVLAVGALAMQVAVIQPGLTNAWNDIVWHSMEMKDAFVEQGVQGALRGVATDSALVPDMDDSDGDRLWGFDGGGQPLDEVSRFGVYYTQRRLNTIPIPVAGSVQDFLDDLGDFLTEGTDAWGLIDDTGPRCDPFAANSECNPCCILPDYWTEEMGCAANVSGDPDIYTPDPVGVASMRTTCGNNSPYGAAYPWVYDAYRGNPMNAFVSFQEQLGRDDEHQLFAKNPAGPNSVQVSEPDPACVAVCAADMACVARCDPFFKLKDTTGFYTPAVYPLNDNRTGVFPFFYKIADWKVNLDTTAEPFDLLNKPYQCHWCDQDDLTAPAGSGRVGPCPADQPMEASQLVLPADAPNAILGIDTPGGAEFNITYCVDGPNPVSGEPPLAVDLVRLPDPADLTIPWAAGIGKIEADVDQCAQNASGVPANGFWKRGGDRFCSAGGDAWPYWGDCPKYGTCPEVIDPDTMETVDPGCACAEPGAQTPDNWPDDLLDDLVYGLNFFADWAKELLAGDATSLGREFKKWYPEAAAWIEPGQSNVPRPVNDPACTATSCCFVCAAEDGELYKWYKAIQDMRNRLQAWRDTSFAGSQCREVWCVPPDLTTESPPYSSCTASFPTPPPAAEEATFDVNGNAIRGDMEDIVACVNWNANDNTVIWADGTANNQYSDGTPVLPGNEEKFKACDDECTANGPLVIEKCSNLPRSLVPLVNTALPDQNDLQRLEGCKNACNNSVCQQMNAVYFVGIGDPATTDFQATQCGTWGAGNLWYDRIITTLAAADVCDPAPGGWLDGIRRSIPEAANQVAKFRQRYNYLSGRINELNGIIAVLDEAEQRFNGFLTCADGPDADTDPDGAACRLIKARIDLDRTETGLPYHAIYGWQDEPRPGDPPGSGRWHIVRADARIPEKCDLACGESQLVGSDPGWPYVRTYTKKWGMKRCYELSRTTGVVKARVTRFDETGRFSTLLFPNAVEIWKPTFERGDRPQTANPDNIEGTCLSSMVPNPGEADAYLGSYYYGAFILNKRVDNAAFLACLAGCGADMACQAACPRGNADCWDLANRLLAGGVTSEACAQYYFHGGTPNGMDFKFVPCQDF